MSDEETELVVKVVFGVVCVVGLCLVGGWAIVAAHSMLSSAHALLQTAGV